MSKQGVTPPQLKIIDNSQVDKSLSPYKKQIQQILSSLIIKKCTDELNRQPKIRIIDSSKPQAFSSKTTIYLSQKLLESFEDFPELLFIYTHELAHIMSCHHNGYQIAQAKEFELVADNLAARVLRIMGYDPKYAYAALNKLYSQNKLGFQLKNYPTIAERIKNLNKTL